MTNPPTPAPGAITLPNVVRVALAILVSAASVLNVTTFGVGGNWATYISAALAFFAYIGISPLTGNAFQTLLLQILPPSVVQTIHGAIGAGLAALAVIVATAHWSPTVTAIVLGIETAVAALGFGPVGTSPVTPSDVARARG